MSYEVTFLKSARKEWNRLDATIRERFQKKLEERLEEPEIPASKLSGSKDRYKIKLSSAGYRLVYEVKREIVTIVVIAVGKRERNAVYKIAAKRL